MPAASNGNSFLNLPGNDGLNLDEVGADIPIAALRMFSVPLQTIPNLGVEFAHFPEINSRFLPAVFQVSCFLGMPLKVLDHWDGQHRGLWLD